MEKTWRDPHILRTIKSLSVALYATLGVFLALFVFFHIVSASYSSYLSQKQIGAFEAGIARDKSYLKEQGDAVARNNELISLLIAGDRKGLMNIANQESSARSIGTIGITDKNGIVLTRTVSPGMYGDNIYLTLPVGRAVGQGKSVQSVELRFTSQLAITSGGPILQNGNMVGGLFASYLMNDAYASNFKKTYLSSGAEVVFYTKGYGVYGDSFSDEDVRTLVQSYFNTGSDWVANGTSGNIVSFPDGRSYIVINEIFPGLEQSPGGALVFIPRMDLTPLANGITAFFTVLTFLFLALRQHFRIRSEERGWRYYGMLVLASLAVYGLAYIALYSQSLGRLMLQHIPYPLYNSTVRLQPEDGMYTTGSEQRVSIIVDTGDENINAVQIGLHFDPTMIQMKSLDMASSTCSYAVENTVDQKAGTARASCILLNRNSNLRAYSIADAVFVPKRAGTFNLSFDTEQTQVLADDGLGTNVLRASQDGSYAAEDFAVLAKNATASSTARLSTIFSPTYPNQNRWYNEPTAHFIWLGSPDADFYYAFDVSSSTIPTNAHEVRGISVDIPVPDDGVFYFHLRSAAGGPVAHYRINADMKPPVILSMNLSKTTVTVGDVVRFSFEAVDPISGIQKNYYVDIGNHLFLPVGPQLFIPFLDAGDQKVTLRVYDGAGNYSERSETVHVIEP